MRPNQLMTAFEASNSASFIAKLQYRRSTSMHDIHDTSYVKEDFRGNDIHKNQERRFMRNIKNTRIKLISNWPKR